MIGLQISMEIDGAWPDVADAVARGDLPDVPMTHIARCAMGTAGGASTVMVRGTLPDGRVVVLQTTMALFLGAARAFQAREEMEATNVAANH